MSRNGDVDFGTTDSGGARQQPSASRIRSCRISRRRYSRSLAPAFASMSRSRFLRSCRLHFPRRDRASTTPAHCDSMRTACGRSLPAPSHARAASLAAAVRALASRCGNRFNSRAAAASNLGRSREARISCGIQREIDVTSRQRLQAARRAAVAAILRDALELPRSDPACLAVRAAEIRSDGRTTTPRTRFPPRCRARAGTARC